ncbi:CsbD family protein [Ensifer sp. ENS09]|nr:CsbD family protein [Ensifer sp. ENS09]
MGSIIIQSRHGRCLASLLGSSTDSPNPAENSLCCGLTHLPVEGNWKQVKGKIKEQWGRHTDDDLDVIDGKCDQLEGKIQERYGYAKDHRTKDIDDWYRRQTW